MQLIEVPCKRISSRRIITAAFFFMCVSHAGAAVLAPGTYMVPAAKLDAAAAVEYAAGAGMISSVDLAFSPLPRLGLGFAFSYIRPDASEAEAVPGDSNFKIKYYAGDFFGGMLSLAVTADFTLPSGPSAYSSPQYRFLSYGNHEFNLGLSAALSVTDTLTVQGAASYIFRGGESENLYSGIRLNPFKPDTWTSIAGLNPFVNDAFMNPEKLKDDCVSVSVSANTKMFYPVIPLFEIYHLRRIASSGVSSPGTRFEGAGIDPLLAVADIRYYIERDFFIETFLVYAAAAEDAYPVISVGIKLQHNL